MNGVNKVILIGNFGADPESHKWQDQNGQDRYSTEIVANEIQMLGRTDG